MLSDVDHEQRSEIARLERELRRERRAREHRLEINHLVGMTSGQVTRHGVARVLARGASEIFSVGWVMVAYVGDDEIVTFVHGPGVPDEIQHDWQTAPIDADVPICEALRGDAERIELTSPEQFAPWPTLVAEAERARAASMMIEPIRSAHGRHAAVIALAWPEPHRMDDQERALLSELAENARPALRRSTTTETDRDVARTLQQWLLPSTLPAVEGLSITAIYEPGKNEMQVGGDWYDLIEIDEHRAAIVVGDVVGHDARAAAEMGQVRHVLASNLVRSADPVQSLQLTDDYFAHRETDTMATALVMVWDRRSHTLQIASAGHLAPIVIESGTAARTLDCGLGPPVGSGMGGYDIVERPFPVGTVVIGFTDGVIEQRDRSIDASVTAFCVDVDRIMATTESRDVVPALTDLVRSWALDPTRRDDAAAIVVQSV